MEWTAQDIEKWEAYLDGKLSETERLALENRLETDEDFRRAARKMQFLREGLTVIQQRQMRQKFQDMDATLPPFEPPTVLPWLKIILVALALVLAAFGVWYFGMKKAQPKVAAPIVAYFEPYPALGIQMGDTPNERKKEAMVRYAQKQYGEAIPLLAASFKETQDSILLFYSGVSHLATGEPNEAALIFEQLQNTQTVPQEATQWYLALSYAGLKQYEKAINLLKNNKSEKYKDKAQKLLEEISKKK